MSACWQKVAACKSSERGLCCMLLSTPRFSRPVLSCPVALREKGKQAFQQFNKYSRPSNLLQTRAHRLRFPPR
jgi:hypothetical protein